MKQYLCYLKKYSCYCLIVILFLLQACSNNQERKVDEEIVKDDTINYNKTHSNPESAINKPVNKADEEIERKQLIQMQIDSTYYAIALLDDAKKELTQTVVQLSATERNKKSKALFNINLLQNELTRALDASILANLKLKVNELEKIVTGLEKDVAHLQQVVRKLNNATAFMNRLANILAMGLSRGAVKPVTPKTPQASDTKL